MNKSENMQKYSVITKDVRDGILSGKYKIGEQLPPDTEMARRYGIDKRTVAKGMAVLVREGLISRAPKRGSVVVASETAVDIKPRSNAVCVISRKHCHFFDEAAQNINDMILDNGFYPVWINWNFDTESSAWYSNLQMSKFFSAIIKDRPYGFIIDADNGMPLDLIGKHIGEMGTVVFMNRYSSSQRLPGRYCIINNTKMGATLAAYFAAAGRRKLAYFSGTGGYPDISSSRAFHEAVAAGMEKYCVENGLFFDRVTTDRFFNNELPIKVLAELKSLGLMPDAAAISSDLFAVREIIPTCGALDISIPGDLALIGAGNTNLCREMHPGLTSVDFCAAEMAQKTVKLLFAPEARNMDLGVKIVERGSVVSEEQFPSAAVFQAF